MPNKPMTKTVILAIILLMAGGFVLQVCSGGAPAEGRNSRGLPNAGRQYLRVCASRMTLFRKDLEEVALRYKVIKDERPDLDAMLDANGDCRVGKEEQLDFNSAVCATQRPNKSCPNGVLFVPIR